jgi:hypothetical protein
MYIYLAIHLYQPGVAWALLRARLSVVRSIALGAQLRYTGVLTNFPTKAEVRRFWHEARYTALEEPAPHANADAAPAVHPFLKNPGKRRRFPSTELLKKKHGRM